VQKNSDFSRCSLAIGLACASLAVVMTGCDRIGLNQSNRAQTPPKGMKVCFQCGGSDKSVWHAHPDIKAGTDGYPPSLETLVEGVTKANDASGVKLKFLRRIPIDPITHSNEWGMRAYGDKPDSTAWGGGNVFDVYTKATGKGLDGTKYRDW